jgi:hypothetical protein
MILTRRRMAEERMANTVYYILYLNDGQQQGKYRLGIGTVQRCTFRAWLVSVGLDCYVVVDLWCFAPVSRQGHAP